MGKKDQTATTSQTQTYTPAGSSQLQDIWNKIQGVTSQGYTPYGGQLTAGLDPTQQAGISTINAAAGSAQPYFDQAADYARSGASPISSTDINRYMSPYTQQVIDATQRQFQENNSQQQQQVVGNAALKGALGGDRVGVAQAELARQQKLAQDPTIAGLYNQGYTQALGAAQADRSAQQQGASLFGSLAPSVQNTAIQGGQAQLGAGAVAQGTNQNALTAQYQQYLQQQAFPYQQAQFLAQYGLPTITAMGGTQTGSGTSTTPGPSPWGQIAGLGMAGISAFSDERVKDNIEKIGKTFDGQNIYSFTYKGDETPRMGLMAQEVEKVAPDAVGEVGGVKTVNYKTATEGAAKKGHFARGGAVDYLDVQSYVPGDEVRISDLSPKMTPMQMPSTQQGGGMGMPSASDLKGFAGGMDAIGNLFKGFGGGGGYSTGSPGGTGLLGFGGLYSQGGAVNKPDFYANGGSTPFSFLDRVAPVEEAISTGAFDPQGQNFTSFKQAPEFTPGAVAGPAPMPMARPPMAQSVPAVAQKMPADLPPEITGPQEPLMALAYSGESPTPLSAPAKEGSKFGKFNPFGLSDDARLGLIAAGLGMAASKSPFALTQVGEGGLRGLQTYIGQKKEAGDRAERQKRIDLEAKRLAQSAEQFAKQHDLTKRSVESQIEARKEAAERGKYVYLGPSADGSKSIFLDQKTGAVEERDLKIGAKPKDAKPLPGSTQKDLGEKAQSYQTLDMLGTAFKPEYAGAILPQAGEAKNWVARQMGIGNKDAAQWWQDYNNYKNVIRNKLFGSALTTQEAREWEKQDINPGMDPDLVRRNIARQKRIIESGLKRRAQSLVKQGYSPDAIEAELGIPIGQVGAPPPSGAAPQRPDTVPEGSAYSPSRKQWRSPEGELFDENGEEID